MRAAGGETAVSQDEQQLPSRLYRRRWTGRQQAARRFEAETAADLEVASDADETGSADRARVDSCIGL
jgi:hypothetical protein